MVGDDVQLSVGIINDGTGALNDIAVSADDELELRVERTGDLGTFVGLVLTIAFQP